MSQSMPEKIGKYHIKAELGSGGFGAVYLAEDRILQERVAIKLFQVRDSNLLSTTVTDEQDAEQVLKNRFLDEARTLRKLSNNPFIVELYDFDQTEDGAPYYVMPYLPHSLVNDIGKDVQDVHVIAELPAEQRPRPIAYPKATLILQQLISALKEVHSAGLVHRDIKPANVLINEKGDVQLCDFGIAKLPDTEHSQTTSGIAMGSRNYMAPEQRESAKHVDATADVYSVGVLAYRLYTGTLPVGRFDDPIKLAPMIPEALNTLVLDCLSQKREDRPANANALLERFKQATSEGPSEGDFDESTGTWVGEGTSGLKDEIKPLREHILSLLKQYGEVPGDEKAALVPLAAVADLDEQGIQILIEECQQSLQAELKLKQNLLRVIDTQLENNTLNDGQSLSAIYKAGESVGWSSEELDTIIERKRGGSGQSKGKKKRKASTAQTQPSRNTSTTPSTPSKLPKAIAAIFAVAALGTGGYFYTEHQAEQARIAQEIAEQQAIAKESETKAWNQAKDKNTEQSYTVYLDTWPEGEHVAQAQQAIKDLQEQARLAQLSAEERQKELVKQIQDYLNRLAYQVPTHGNLDQRTIGNIKAFERDQGQPEIGAADEVLLTALKAEYTKRDNWAWNKAKKAHTGKAYRQYQQDYPQGKYVNQVAGQIEKVKTELEAARIAEANAKAEAERKYKERLAKNKREGQALIEAYVGTLVSIPSGSFQMGSNKGEDNEKPVRTVDIQGFKMMAKELTWAQYQPCVDAGVCSSASKDEGWGKGNRPVINVSWHDTQTYIGWLNKKTGERFRLPSEAEWEYAARAGSTTKYTWGDSISCSQARYGYFSNECGRQHSTDPVGSFPPNKWGLYDMHGNVWKWTEDCWHSSYQNAPVDGRAWESENEGDCAKRVLRGGSWYARPYMQRSANRNGRSSTKRSNDYGFRLVQDG